MRKFLLQLAALFAIVAAFDVACGLLFPCLVSHARGGDNGRNNLICNEVEDAVLVFGSSRAIHHYSPVILADSIGLSCYNCGQDGNGSILHYGRLRMMTDRYHPRLVVYDVFPGFDLLAGDNRKYLGLLRPYYYRDGIRQIFWDVDPTERWKMMSAMYRYNSRFIQIVSDCVSPQNTVGIRGFRPIDKEMDLMKIDTQQECTGHYDFDSLKIAYLNKIVELCGTETRLVFAVSPVWYGMDSLQFAPVRAICRQRGIPFIDFSNHPKYVHNNAYFKDGAHLNARGAFEFTRDFAAELGRRGLMRD